MELIQIGEGTYGKVFKAKLKESLVEDASEFRALKKLKLDHNNMQPGNGFPITSTREIQILKLASHENIVKLIQVTHTHTHHHPHCNPSTGPYPNR